jgi:hypothetical protein
MGNGHHWKWMISGRTSAIRIANIDISTACSIPLAALLTVLGNILACRIELPHQLDWVRQQLSGAKWPSIEDDRLISLSDRPTNVVIDRESVHEFAFVRDREQRWIDHGDIHDAASNRAVIIQDAN